jgi:branched-subunit amino acid transport protein AzlD
MLVVYCVKDVAWLSGTHGLPELLGIAATILIHLWRRNMLWSIAGGTLFYIIIIRLI